MDSCDLKFFYGVINKMQSHSNAAFHCKNVNTTAEANPALIQAYE